METSHHQASTFRARRGIRLTSGSILVGLLWCVALLSLVVVSVLHTSRIDLMAGKNYGDRIQAHYLAVAGIEKAKALIFQNARERSRSGRNHSGDLYNSPDQFRDVAFGRGKFRIFRRGQQSEGGGVVYGISDEESRLNVNSASSEQLTNLNGMTTEIASAILDWRGNGSTNTAAANADYYSSLRPPYQPRHGALLTVRELLLVRGVTRDLLFGNDRHQNDLLPVTGEGDDDSLSMDSGGAETDVGWAGLLSISSTEKNVNAAGQDRVNVQTADQTALTGVKGITSAIASAIVSYRGQNKLQSLADLLDVTAQNPSQNSGQNSGGSQVITQGGTAPGNGSTGSSANASGAGGQVISQDALMEFADDITVADGDLNGLINVNTAALEVLICLPGVDRQLAQAIILHRQSSGFFANPAELLKVSGMTSTLLKQIAPLVTVRSETYRILSEGRVTSTGARQRIQAIVHIDLKEVSTLGYREDNL